MIPENGARMSVFASRAAASASRRFGDLEIVLGFVARLARDEALLLQIDRALVFRFRERQVGLRLLHFRGVDSRIELDEHRVLRDGPALLEADRDHTAGDLGAKRHRFVRAQAAHRGDHLRHRRRRCGDRFDNHGGRRARGALVGRLRRRARGRFAGGARALLAEPIAAARGKRDGDDGDGRDDRYSHSRFR